MNIKEPLTVAHAQSAAAIKPANHDDTEGVLLNIAPIAVLVFSLLLVGAGLVVATIIWPDWLSATWNSISAAQPKAFWYISRSSAMVAYVLLWLSMASGLAITNKMMRVWPGGPTLVALHEYASLLGLVLAIVHALILLGDSYLQYTLSQLLIPFASENYRQLWVGLGQVAMYLLIPVTLTFYVRRWIGYKLWRRIHYVSFGVFALALAHGLMSGSESSLVWVRNMYWASGMSMVGLVIYRIMLQRAANKQAALPTASKGANRA